MAVTKPYNGSSWTEARFQSFIKGALRAASRRWGPRNEVKKEARRGRGKYLCAGYGRRNHIVAVSLGSGRERRNNVFVDHRDPVVDPKKGFVDWNTTIERMFCEAEGLQVLCHDCHTKKTSDERSLMKKSKSGQ